jgi:regulator of RNase E activity RraA
MSTDRGSNAGTDLLASARKKLFSAVIGDVMDDLGLLERFLPPRIRPLSDDMVLVGWAMPVLEQDIARDSDGAVGGAVGDRAFDRPFGLMLEALDGLQPDEVYLASGSSSEYALWGGLMSNRAISLGAAGAVLDGYSRDTREIRSLGFPTFSYGAYAQDQRLRGRVVDYRQRITVGSVVVEPGDLVFGDLDGVCVVPRSAVEPVLRAALEKVEREDLVRRHILAGNSTTEAFERFGAM